MTDKRGIQHIWDAEVPMRDGVVLSADIYLPPEGEDGGPYPVVLQRTPYNNQNDTLVGSAAYLANKGYAVVAQDVRGRNDSRGFFYPFLNEGPDGYDTIEWIAEQSWSNGKVGMMGGSYGGWVQWAAAREKPPHLTTLVSSCAAGRWMQEVPYKNGMVSLEMFSWLNLIGGHAMQNNALVDWERVYYHLPLRTMDEELGREVPAWQDWLDHPVLDDYWKQILLTPQDFGQIDLPVLHITGWYDDDQDGAFFFYQEMVEHSPASENQSILVGPWDHRGTRLPKQKLGGVDFGLAAVKDMNEVHDRWFEYWLKGTDNGVKDDNRVRYFMMGSNEWRESNSWPETEPKEFFLHSSGKANSLRGDGELSLVAPGAEPKDEYTYNPENPAISVMDINFFPPPPLQPLETPLDRRFLQRRSDVLVYTSEPLQSPLEVMGVPIARIHASSDCVDTDWVVNLTDVNPDGKAVFLSQGVLRARFRESVEYEKLMEPGQVYEFEISLWAIGHVFQPGHSIRFTVTSSDFPHYDRNPNTGKPIGQDADMRIALNSVFHDSQHPSRVLLPAVLKEATDSPQTAEVTEEPEPLAPKTLPGPPHESKVS